MFLQDEADYILFSYFQESQTVKIPPKNKFIN